MQREGTTYSFYKALPKDELRGEQIGVVDNNKSDKVFAVKGYPLGEWIIEYNDVEMSVYTLYKADKVKKIPDELN